MIEITSTPVIRWGVKHFHKNRLDGTRIWLEWNYDVPRTFTTRAQARKYVDEKYGYIRNRPDLRKEPCGWKTPKVVKVKVILEEV